MQYDLAIVGGGIAGSTLGMTLARHGARVVIVEKQPAFRDRNRGEVTHPWGVAEAITLSVYQPLLQSCGQETRYAAAPVRDLVVSGGLRVYAGDYAAAQEEFVRAMRLSPVDPLMRYTWLNLGVAMIELGEVEQAIDYFRRTIAAGQNEVFTMCHLMDALGLPW